MVGKGFAEGALLLVFDVRVRGEGGVRGEALGHLPLELGQLAGFLLEQLRHVLRTVLGQLLVRHQRVGREMGMVAANEVGEARPDDLDVDEIAPMALVAGDGAG